MSKKICGIEVDEKFYKEFMTRRFAVADKNVPANIVEIYATSRDFAENAPEIAEAARKAQDQIRAEIKEHIATQNGRKGLTMNYNNFRSIFAALKEAYTSSAANGKQIFADWEKAQAAYYDIKSSASADQKERVLAEGDFLRAKEKFKTSHKELAQNTEEKAAELRKALEEAAAAHYKVKPGKVDMAALELLKLGIPTDSDISQLASDYGENPTMLAVIGKYAGEREKSQEMRYLANEISKKIDREKEIKVFDTLCDYGARIYSTDVVKRKTIDRIFDKMFDDAIANASDHPIDME